MFNVWLSCSTFYQHNPSHILAVHFELSLRHCPCFSLFCQTSETCCPHEPTCDLRINLKVSGCSCCYNSKSKHQQNLLWMACKISHCIINSHLRRNSIRYPWNDCGGHVLNIILLSTGGMSPILSVSRALQDVRVIGEPKRGAGWTGSVGTTADQMLGINQSHWHGASHQVTSRGVPISFRLIKTYGKKTEAITVDAKVKCI